MKGTFCGGRLGAFALVALLLILAVPATAFGGVAGGGVSVSAPVQVSVPAPAAPAAPAVQAPAVQAPAIQAPSAPAAPAVPAAPAAPAVAAPATPAVTAKAAATAASFPAPRLTIPATVKVTVTPHSVKTTVASSVAKAAPVNVAHIVTPKAHAKLSVKVAAKGHVKVKVPSVVTRKVAANPNCPPSDTAVHCVNQPWDAPLENFCNGDIVHTMGTFQYYIQTSFDPISMTVTTFERSNFQNVSGVVTESADPTNIGNPYQANDTEKTYQNTYPVPVGGFTMKTQHDENNELISKGPDVNQIVHLTTNTTLVVNPTAVPPVQVTATTSGPGLKCTG
jgi:hypothetical protein